MTDANTPDPFLPSLPPGKIVNLGERGETFARVMMDHEPEAPTVLLLHGWLASADLNWFGCYAALSQRWNVIAIDHRGHGRGIRSPRPFALEAAADDAAALLQALHVTGPVVAVGYSMGGPIAMHLAHRHPERVQGLVATATALTFRSSLRERITQRLLPVLGMALRLDASRVVVERLAAEVGPTDVLVAAWRAQLIGESMRTSTRNALEAGRALGRYDATPWAGELRLPAVVVATTKDRLVPLARQRDLAAALGARQFDVDGDHDILVRRPALFADTIRAAVAAVVEQIAAERAAGVVAPGPTSVPLSPVAQQGVAEAGAARSLKRLRHRLLSGR